MHAYVHWYRYLKGIIMCFQREISLSLTISLTFKSYFCIHAQHFVQKRSLNSP